MTIRPISPERIAAAATIIDPDFLDTPVIESKALDAAIGARVYLKDESANPIGAFKGRGTEHFVKTCIEPGAELVCASAGNFGQGLARSGVARGCKVTVFAATTASPVKIERMRGFGADVRLYGSDFDAANAEARRYARENGLRYVEDCDIPEVAEGAGTIARELTEDGVAFDAIYVPVGGGALANGIGLWLRQARPGCKVIGVCAEGAPALHRSWHEHRLIELDSTNTIADGIAVRAPVAYAMEHLAKALDDVVLVSDARMIEAMRLVQQTTGLAIEPAAASVVAAMMNAHGHLPSAVAAPISGSNLTAEQKAKWLG